MLCIYFVYYLWNFVDNLIIGEIFIYNEIFKRAWLAVRRADMTFF
jgi:hypothetical protein